MQPSPAHTRTRTLQERLGIPRTYQNGSTGVRSVGRHAGELNPAAHQHDGIEEIEEDDYFNELRSPAGNHHERQLLRQRLRCGPRDRRRQGSQDQSFG